MKNQHEDSGNTMFLLVCLMIVILLLVPAWYVARAGKINGGLLELAKALNLSVIAEGVETREQIDFLSAVGHENIQGYYFSTPLPLQDFHY